MTFSQVLIDTLNELPYIQEVWIDEKGNYFLTQKAGCSWYSRAEVLGMTPAVETTEVPAVAEKEPEKDPDSEEKDEK